MLKSRSMGVEGYNDLLKFLEISANKKLINDIDASLYDSQSLVLKIADSRTHRPIRGAIKKFCNLAIKS